MKSIIILGTGASSRFCDFRSDEIWGVNGTYTIPHIMPKKFKKFFRTDKLFMTDSLFSHEEGTLNFDIKAMNRFAKKYNCQMFTLNKLKLGKYEMNATQYPYKALTEYFGSEYFTDTICYMIAYALYTHSHLAINEDGVVKPDLDVPLKIRLFGIDMSTTREYQQSKGGVEFWLGIARGMGCEIENVQGSVILRSSLGVPYGKWNRLRISKKKYDPLGLMSGKEPTIEEANKLAEKLRKEEETQGGSSEDNQEPSFNLMGDLLPQGYKNLIGKVVGIKTKEGG